MGFFRRKSRTDLRPAGDDEVESFDPYPAARSGLLAPTAAQLAAAPPDAGVLALVMESRVQSSVWATVVMADGTTSLYFDGGRSILGAGRDEHVVAAARAWLQSCA